jgi:hypothetical protein
MSFDEIIIWQNHHARAGELEKVTYKPAKAPGSHSLRSITSWVWEADATYLTRHLYLSDHHDQKNGVHVPRFEYYENRKDLATKHTVSLQESKRLLHPRLAALQLTYGDADVAELVTEALAEVIPGEMVQYVPLEGTTGAQRLIAARFPLLRHLAETQGIVLPEQIPTGFASLLERDTARSALAGLVGEDGRTRAGVAELGRILVVGGRVRTREASMLVAARGLPRDIITDVIRGIEPVGDGTAMVTSDDGRAAAEVLGGLGADRHRQAITDLLARDNGHEQLTAIGQHRQMPIAGVRDAGQLAGRARRRGPFDHLDQQQVEGTDLRLEVIYPGDNAELTVLGTQMRNCIRHYGRTMPFREGAIIAARDHRGRATHAIQVNARGQVTGWQGRGGAPPPPATREQVAQTLIAGGITMPPAPMPFDGYVAF